jgi:hypothetical protein
MNKIQEMSFISRDLVLVMVGRHSTNEYPKVEAKMPVYIKRTFAYQVSKCTLESLPINIRLIIKAMTTQLICNATADGLMYDWKSVLDKGWYNPELLQILSFHNSAGNEITDTTTIADASILLPMVNGIIANCHKPDVRFVCIQITLKYAALFSAGHTGPTSIKSMYYIKLPITAIPMTTSARGAYNLTTYHGPGNLRAMTATKVSPRLPTPAFSRAPSYSRMLTSTLPQPMSSQPSIMTSSTPRFSSLGSSRYALPCSGSSAPAIPTSLMRSSSTSAS